MSLGFSKFETAVVSVAFLTSCLALNYAQAQGKPQARRLIEMSETNSAEILTNLNQLNAKKEALKALDEQLRLPKSGSGQSMEDRFSLPYGGAPPVLSNKKLKELLDRQKNWALTPEALSVSATLDESDTSSGYGNKKKDDNKSSLRQFYDALSGQDSSKESKDRTKDNRSVLSKSRERELLNDSNVDDDSGLPAALRDKTQDLKKSINADPNNIFSTLRSRSSFDNFFGTADNNNSSQDSVAPPKPSEKSFLEQYKRGLDPSVAAGLNPALSALVPNNGVYGAAVVPDLTKLPGTVRPETPGPAAGNINSLLGGTPISDVNATVLNQWNPLYTPSKFELPKVAPATVPTFELPRRRF